MEQVASIEELLTEILVRVPARPLVRFKCVSKHWLSLISNPEFCHRHTLQNPNASVSAVFPWTSTSISALSFIPLGDFDHNPKSNYANQTLFGSPNSCNPRNFVPNLHRIMILQSCNGLFLCCPFPSGIARQYYILNPTTNQFSILTPPAAASVDFKFRILGEALAFDPSTSLHYNVVVFWTNNNTGRSICHTDFRIELYSSETKSWKLVDSTFSLPFFCKYDGAVYCNGAVHWIGVRTRLSYYHIDSERVGYVNELDTDRGAFDRRFRFLQESHCGGSFLHLIDIYLSRIEVSEVERDYSGWCLKYHIDLDHIFTIFPREFVVLFLTPEEKQGDVSSLLLHTPGKVISYNLKCKTYKSFRLTPRQGIDDSKLRVEHQNFRYMETLACV